MRTYVINLERSVERREFMDEQLGDWDHEFVQAIQARDLRRDDWPKNRALDMTACSLSHALAQQRVLGGGETGLVCEDDVLLPLDLPEMLGALELSGPMVALLHYRGHRTHRKGTLGHDTGYLWRPLTPVSSAACYAITPEACERMLGYGVAQHGHFSDDWHHFPVEVRCVVPRVVHHNNNLRSTLSYADGSRLPAFVRRYRDGRRDRRMSRFELAG